MKITISPILNEADYENALDEIQSLMQAKPGTKDGAKLDVLVTLLEAYEERHWPIDPPDPLEAIRARMEGAGLRQKDLEPMIGSRGRVSEILSGRRALTLPMIRRLATGLGLSADILVRERPAVARGATRRPRKAHSDKVSPRRRD